MITLPVHDTKRSEGMRIWLAVPTEYPREWEHCVGEPRAATSELHSALLNGGTELLLWQALVATWILPSTTTGAEAISTDRLTKYLTKAMQGSKFHTSWTSLDEGYESVVIKFTTACLTTPGVGAILDAFTEPTFPSACANILGQELTQLTMPGVSDLYQGCEVADLSLVDPDNRRPIDYYRRSGVLTALNMNPPVDLGAEKFLMTSWALLLCRGHPEMFRGLDTDYRSVSLNIGHAVVFRHGYGSLETPVVIMVATRVQSRLSEKGWGDAELVLPNLWFHDVLAGREYPDDVMPLADILNSLPVALFVHQVD